jgi:hypothetical protein
MQLSSGLGVILLLTTITLALTAVRGPLGFVQVKSSQEPTTPVGYKYKAAVAGAALARGFGNV